MRNARSRFVVAAVTFLSLSLVTAACSGAAGPTPESSITVDVFGTPFTLEALPERIISLSPSSTEGLFAIGAGPQVIAVDEFSDYPAEAPTTALSGFTPNIEAIVALDPDLVIVSYDPGDFVDSLAATGVPVLVLTDAVVLEDVLEQLRILGAVTGNVDQAASVVADLETRLEAAFAAGPDPARQITFFHELDATLYSVTSETFIGDVYRRFGLENIADAASPDGAGARYPQLSSEFLLAADPDLVFLSDAAARSEDATTFAARPGLSGLSAVTDGAIIELDDDIASRWGPRIVDFVEQIARSLAAFAATAVVLR
jgi:iron complex transport system substrate-binding protein